MHRPLSRGVWRQVVGFVGWIGTLLGSLNTFCRLIDMPHLNTCNTNQIGSVPIPSNTLPTPESLEVFLDQTGKACAVVRDKGNPYALAVGSPALNALHRQRARQQGKSLKSAALEDLNDRLKEDAEDAGHTHTTWNRVAAVKGGIEIDLGDDAHTRLRIVEGTVETVTKGSKVIFRRHAHSRSMVMPAPKGKGNYKLLKDYLNLNHVLFKLLVGWMSYTLAHPKVRATKYVILQIIGGQGTGKSHTTKLIKQLIDPAITDVQVMPTDPDDLAIAGQQSHLLCYDNLRDISKTMSDRLCVAATGGTLGGRRLYTNDEQHVVPLHVALVLNGIHPFVSESDLADRCLPLHLEAIATDKRRSEAQMEKDLERDLPIIFRGLLDLIAEIQISLPAAKVTSPERMIEFSGWLAGMELAESVPAGTYQDCYSDILKQGQRDTLMDNVLAAAVLKFSESVEDGCWSGTPAQLLAQLNFLEEGERRSRAWPDNPAALSKRLMALQAALMSQGVGVELTRGKERRVTITRKK